MEINPVFAYPNKFSEISGLSAKEIRSLCQQQIIPNERTNRGFRIDVKGALAALQNRAAEFMGHVYKAKRVNAPFVPQQPRAKAGSFRDMLDTLKHA